MFFVIIAVVTAVLEIQEVEYIFQHIYSRRRDDYLRDFRVIRRPIEHVQCSGHVQQVRILARISKYLM